MPDDTDRRIVEKGIAMALVIVWSIGTIMMTLTSVETTTPPHWLPFTALVFLLVGRLWDLEVEQYLPGRGGS